MVSLTTLTADSSVDEIEAVMARDGAVIIGNLAAPDQLAVLRAELNPWLSQTPTGKGEFHGFKTRRCCGLLGKSSMAGEFATNPKILEFCDRILLPQCTRYRLSLSQAMSVGPSEKVQFMHRDDTLWPFRHPVEHHRVINMIWALTDFTEHNGATRVAPGSHLWGENREPVESEVTKAVMPAGSVLIYYPDTFHGAGANETSSPRDGMILGYIVGWLRQEEEQFLAVPPSVAKTLPRNIQDLLGYKTHEPYLGWVDLNDCRIALLDVPESERGAADLSGEGETDGELHAGHWSVLI